MPLHIPHLEGACVNMKSSFAYLCVMALSHLFHRLYPVGECMCISSRSSDIATERLSFMSAAIVLRLLMFKWGKGASSVPSLSEESTEGEAEGVRISEGACVCDSLWWEDAMFPRPEQNISGILCPWDPSCSLGDREREADEFRDAVPSHRVLMGCFTSVRLKAGREVARASDLSSHLHVRSGHAPRIHF